MSYGTHTSANLALARMDDTEEVSLDEPRQSVLASTPLSHHPTDGGHGKRPTPPSSLPGIAPAMANVPLTSPPSRAHVQQAAGSVGGGSVQERLDSIKAWSISTYKYSRQLISEKLGKTSRTVDAELDTQIERLRETQRKYLNILKLARALSSHLYNMINTQLQLSEQFAELGQRSPELQREFVYNSDTQRSLHKHGNSLLASLNSFVSSVNTLCNKTMDDTLITVRQYESARVEYDAYRSDIEWLRQCGEYSDDAGASSGRAVEAKRQLDVKRALYEQLRHDVTVKLRFLDENRVKVMHKQLLLLHQAVCAYFSGNQLILDSNMRQFNSTTSTTVAGSFLESSTSSVTADAAARRSTTTSSSTHHTPAN